MSIKKNYVYNLSYQILTLIIPIVTTPYVSRILQPDGVGAYSYTLSIVTYFNLVGNWGLSTYGQLKISEYRDDKCKQMEAFAGIFLSRLLMFMLMIGLYTIASINANSYKELHFALIINLFASAIDITWFFQGLELFKITVLRNTIVKIASMAAIFVFVKKKEDLILYAVILQGATVIGNITLWPLLKKFYTRIEIKKVRIFTHFRYSFAYFVPTIATSVYTVLDKSMIGWITKLAEENGYYEQAHRIAQVSVTVLTSLSTVVLPRNRYLFSLGRIEDIKIQINKNVRFVLFIAIPMGIGMIAISSQLIPIYLGNGYEECIPLLNVFSMLALVIGLNNTMGMQCLVPCGKQNKYNIGVIIGAIVNLLLNAFLIPLCGAVGAAIASVSSEFTIAVVFYLFTRDIVSIKDSIRPFICYLTAGIIMLMFIKLEQHFLAVSLYSLGVMICTGIVVYVGTLLIFKETLVKSVFDRVIRRNH